MRIKYRFLLILLILGKMVVGQPQNSAKQIQVTKVTGKIKIDGVLSEKEWDMASPVSGFWQHFPYDTGLARIQTEVRVLYDDEKIYVSAICHNPGKGKYVVQSLKRDFHFSANDAFGIFINTYNDFTNGFSFVVNPYGAVQEAMISGGGGFGTDKDWDNKWKAETQMLEDRWIAEISIPFKSLRFQKGEKVWHVNFVRNNLQTNEQSSWVRIPRNLAESAMMHSGELIFESPPKSEGANIALIPYLKGGYSEDRLTAPDPRISGDAGFDGKMAITPGLNLDVTVNSDFSQVEVDQQQLNLTRFSLFFPEKRQFFLENSDLFSQFGFRQIRPFFSRRIGLENGVPIPIIAGARLSGKLTGNFRLGLMNMQTAGNAELGVDPQNYSVMAFQQQVFRSSNIAGIFVNKQSFADGKLQPGDYNRIAGLDYNILSKNGKWRGKLFFHKAFTPEQKKEEYAHASWLIFNTPGWFLMWNHEYVGKNYIAETGFVPRNQFYDPVSGSTHRRSYWRLEPQIQKNFYPKALGLQVLKFGIYGDHYFDSSFTGEQYHYRPFIEAKFLSTATFYFYYHEEYTRLYFPAAFFPGQKNYIPSGDYRYRSIEGGFSSNIRHPFYFVAEAEAGSFYSGKRYSLRGGINYRYQPWGIFSLNIQNENLDFPASIGKANLILAGPKVELSFRRNIFFTTFIQYNTQAENLNIYSKFQWRYLPLSDFFLVYTDNYSPALEGKNRAVILKLVYWFSI